ncbi:MAG: hypothetical protein DRO40_02545 [Thermoprotei archaeon]|nr:MAG: hypothetical protein DRO40_02545 [Thermoprotei archaeon]
MAEELPESLRAKLLKKLWKETLKRAREAKDKEEQKSIDTEKLVWSKLSDERAKELLEKTKSLYPEAYPYVIRILGALLVKGAVSELDGITVYGILQRLGIPVRPDLRIRFVKRGKEVDFKEYMGD